ncbi:MAG: hypothetical protein V3S70_01620, partial [Gammaproteobacteria bacterium]
KRCGKVQGVEFVRQRNIQTGTTGTEKGMDAVVERILRHIEHLVIELKTELRREILMHLRR